MAIDAGSVTDQKLCCVHGTCGNTMAKKRTFLPKLMIVMIKLVIFVQIFDIMEKLLNHIKEILMDGSSSYKSLAEQLGNEQTTISRWFANVTHACLA